MPLSIVKSFIKLVGVEPATFYGNYYKRICITKTKLKSNKYWFGKMVGFGTQYFGFFIPLSWEGWLVTSILALYFISLVIFQNSLSEYWFIFVLSIPTVVLPYYIIASKKQNPKYKRAY
jgi:hypothetical protein